MPDILRVAPILSLFTAVTIWAGSAGCDSKSATSVDDASSKQVAAIEVTPPTIILAVGAQRQVVATVVNAAHEILTGHTVSWSTDAALVAMVAPDGTITAIGSGTATITATTNGKQATVLVTVTAAGGGASGGGGDLIVVNPSVQYQTITGWEAHAQSGHEAADFALFRDNLLDQAVNDLGITRLRVEVRSGTENSQD